MFRDPKDSILTQKQKKAKGERSMNLRPNQNEVLKKDITAIFQTFNDEKEKSQKSLRSSERLSKHERNRIRDTIFA